MNILITGGRGYIGSRLVKAYNSPENKVYIWTREGISDGNITMNYSLLAENDVLEAISKIVPKIIIHCAGAPDVWKSIGNPSEDLKGNYITTHNLLYSMKKIKLNNSRIVILSSAAVYGNPSHLPITEAEEAKPLTPYALHKHFSELLCEYMNCNYNLDTKVVRLFSVFGPGIKKQILWDMYNKWAMNNEITLFGDGTDTRDYIYIDDAVNAIKIVADNAPYHEIIYNVANGEEITIKTVAETFCEKFGISKRFLRFTGKAREGDPANWLADISKLQSLGYKKTVSFENGIGHYTDWLHNCC